jgi:hypothetical protein
MKFFFVTTVAKIMLLTDGIIFMTARLLLWVFPSRLKGKLVVVLKVKKNR